ncbi:MAG: hypothetical protein HY511_02370 [Actinobacteria bacterium]|nr:hypothetical protein [Actinomycetota bacterium]
MTRHLPIALSATALFVALFGSTPLGGAADSVVAAVPPFATKAGYATNAGAVNGIKASRTAKAGHLVPLGADGKFPASVGQAGPPGAEGGTGPKGDAGPQGLPGLSGVQIVTADSVVDLSFGVKEATATCPSGKKVIGGGAESISSKAYSSTGFPAGDNAWKAEGAGGGVSYGVRAYAICATVTP